jgi:hypothetical protein
MGGGTLGAALPCGSAYLDGWTSFMAYGPFSLSDASEVRYAAQLWANVFSPDDLVGFSFTTDGVNFTYDLFGDTDGAWVPVSRKLSEIPGGAAYLGQPEVYFGILFRSDEIAHLPEGAYMDDIRLEKCVGGMCRE